MMFQLPPPGCRFHFQRWAGFEKVSCTTREEDHHRPYGRNPFDIRPSPGHPGVRICDSVSNLRELRRAGRADACLIVGLDATRRRTRYRPWRPEQIGVRARYGLSAVIILDADSGERLVTDDLADVLTRLEPVAKSLNCAGLAAVSDIYRDGASQRQLRVAQHDATRFARGS